MTGTSVSRILFLALGCFSSTYVIADCKPFSSWAEMKDPACAPGDDNCGGKAQVLIQHDLKFELGEITNDGPNQQKIRSGRSLEEATGITCLISVDSLDLQATTAQLKTGMLIETRVFHASSRYYDFVASHFGTLNTISCLATDEMTPQEFEKALNGLFQICK